MTIFAVLAAPVGLAWWAVRAGIQHCRRRRALDKAEFAAWKPLLEFVARPEAEHLEKSRWASPKQDRAP